MKSKLWELGIGDTVIWDGEDSEIVMIKGHDLQIQFEDKRVIWIDERELHF